MVLFYNYSKEKNNNKRRDKKMIEDEIKNLREKLNKSIADDEKYEIIYKLSIELDELITKYYMIKGNYKI